MEVHDCIVCTLDFIWWKYMSLYILYWMLFTLHLHLVSLSQHMLLASHIPARFDLTNYDLVFTKPVRIASIRFGSIWQWVFRSFLSNLYEHCSVLIMSCDPCYKWINLFRLRHCRQLVLNIMLSYFFFLPSGVITAGIIYCTCNKWLHFFMLWPPQHSVWYYYRWYNIQLYIHVSCDYILSWFYHHSAAQGYIDTQYNSWLLSHLVMF